MATTPITPPSTGGTPAQRTLTNGQDYDFSGYCSGVAFSHTQSLMVNYESMTYQRPSGTWLAGTETLSALQLTIFYDWTQSLEDMNFSTISGDCRGAANARQLHVMAVSSPSQTTAGLGMSGLIYTSAVGEVRRWSKPGDAAGNGGNTYWRVLYEIPENMLHAARTNDDIALTVCRDIISKVQTGGMQYFEPGAVRQPGITPAVPEFRTNLVYI